MKALLIFFLLALASCDPITDDSSDTVEDGENIMNNTRAIMNVKESLASEGGRSFGGGYDYCVSPCESTWRDEQGLRGGQFSLGWNMTTHCRAHDNLKRCVSNCGDYSEAKKEILKRVAKDEFVCHESTFVQNAVCLEQAYRASPQCKRYARCGKYEHTQGTSIESIRQICLSLKCKFECQAPAILEKCGANGEAAKRDEAGMAKKVVEYLKWLAFDYAKRPHVYPARDCDPVMNLA